MAEASAPLRPFWSGVVTFGLVSIPVELYSAIRSGRPSLRMLGPSGQPLKRRYLRPGTTHALAREEIVRGVQLEPGRFVTVTDEELRALEPRKTREIDLRRFVERAAIDPLYFDRPYFLLPPDEITKPYRLLVQTLDETGMAGIASFVMRGREHLVALFAEGGLLAAETLRHPDEIRSPSRVGLPAPVTPPPEQVQVLKQAIHEASEDRFDLKTLCDEEAQALRQVALQKDDEERTQVAPDEDGETGDVVDLMQVIRDRLGVGAAAGDG